MNKKKDKARWQLLDKQIGTETPERVKKNFFQRTKTGQTWMRGAKVGGKQVIEGGECGERKDGTREDK